jgi:hypothetical protein
VPDGPEVLYPFGQETNSFISISHEWYFLIFDEFCQEFAPNMRKRRTNAKRSAPAEAGTEHL